MLSRWMSSPSPAFTGDSGDIYAETPMCDASGVCGEDPNMASPRTKFTAKSKEEYRQWWMTHEALKISATEFSKTISTDNNGSLKNKRQPLVFLGDSITESWLGTRMGKPARRCDGIPQVFENRFSSDLYYKLVLAIGGDQTQHLLYRLQHGELTSEIATRQDVVFVLMIGTNNIGYGHLPNDASKGILKVTDYLLAHTNGRIILMHLLPRDDSFKLERLCPPRCDKNGKPFASFAPAIDKVNKAIDNFVLKLKQQYGQERLSLVDCGGPFVSSSSSNNEVADALMPDMLHPNAAGHELLASCIVSCITRNNC